MSASSDHQARRPRPYARAMGLLTALLCAVGLLATAPTASAAEGTLSASTTGTGTATWAAFDLEAKPNKKVTLTSLAHRVVAQGDGGTTIKVTARRDDVIVYGKTFNFVAPFLLPSTIFHTSVDIPLGAGATRVTVEASGGSKLAVSHPPTPVFQPPTASNADLSLTKPMAQGGTRGTPATWNGTITYDVQTRAVLEPPNRPDTARVTADPVTVEEGKATTLEFSRTGSLVDPLIIEYSTGGTATSGTDYAALSGTATIPAGQTTVDIPVTTLADDRTDPNETLIVSITDAGDFDTSVAPPATITITEPGTPPPPGDGDPCTSFKTSSFVDVAPNNVHLDKIACMAGLGITRGGVGGRPANEYGPNLQTSRAQMASFVVRIADKLGIALPANPANAFDDDDTSVHQHAINQLAAIGVIGGNGESGRSYFPERTINRGEMASFLNGLIDAKDGAPLTSATDAFTDDESSPYEADINGLAEAEIVKGRDGKVYDPNGTVQRDSMASFLIRTLQYLS